MPSALEEAATSLKQARERKGLSQRTLSKLSGVPQGQISKIENGTVDLRLTSLIELARALDLELMLVPRKTMPAIKAIVRGTEGALEQLPPHDRRQWEKLQAAISDLQAHDPKAAEYREMQRYLNEMRHMQASLGSSDLMKTFQKALKTIDSDEGKASRKAALHAIRSMRNQLAHASPPLQSDAAQKPAYTLDEDDDA